jgi:SAM-dependent methyltransferase
MSPPATAVPPSPAPIFELATAFMRSKHLFTASELGLFTCLGAGPRTLGQLADELRLPARTLRIVTDAVTALGLLVHEGGTYRNTEVAQTYLSGRGPVDMRPFMRFFDRLSYVRWMTLQESVRLGRGTSGPFNFNAEEQQIFSEGVAGATDSHALALAASYDFGSRRRILDLGGGTGNFLTAILGRFPDVQATLFELPGAAAVAREQLTRHPCGRQITVVGGDFFRDPLPAGHDTVLLAHVIHVLTAERNRELLRRARQAVARGAKLLIVDFWTNATHTEPLAAALMAGEFMVVGGDGDVYSVEEGRAFLEAGGWRFLEHRPLEGPVSLLVGEAS